MTQKRGLGRGLGALIPGAGPTAPRSTAAPAAPAAVSPEPAAVSASSPAEAEQAASLRTRNHPRTSPEPGESGAGSRPVDMFFSGDPVGGAERPARGSGNGRDVAGAMARAAAERRAAKKTPSRSTAAQGTGTQDTESAGATGTGATRTSTRNTDATGTGAKGTRTKNSSAKGSAAKNSAAKSPAAPTPSSPARPEVPPVSLEPATRDELAATGLEHTPAGIVAGHPTEPGSEPVSAPGPAPVPESAPSPERGPVPTVETARTAETATTVETASTAEADRAPAVEVETVTPTPAAARPGQAEDASSAATEEPSTESVPDTPGALAPGAGEAEAMAPSKASAPASPVSTSSADETQMGSAANDEPSAMAAEGADTELLPVPGAEFAEIPIHEIRENPRNPRTQFDDDALDELAYSLREVGVLQPVVVRPIPATEAGESFELVMGERRWRAARRAGLASIPAIIRETSDDDLLRDALLENLHRSQLNPLEEAAAYQQLLEDFGCTQDELADRIGRSRPQISNTLRLMKLPPLVQRRLASGALSAGHARALLSLDNPTLMEELAQRIVAEGLSVRAVERLVSTGAEPARTRSTPRRSTYDPHVVDLTSRLSNRLEAPVRIDVGKRKGRITLEFTNLDDLERLIERIGLEAGDDGSSED